MLILLCDVAFAHTPEQATPGQPLVIGNLTLLVLLYAVGFARLWTRSVRMRPILRGWGAAFAGGIGVTGVALFSRLDPMADALAWAHMLQHLLLMMVAAPLLVLGAPAQVIAPWGLPAAVRSPVARVQRAANRVGLGRYLLWQPVATWSIYALTLWIWHLPALYEGALRYPLLHDVQHLAFVAAAALFWRVVLDPVARGRMGRGLAVVYLFGTSLQAMLLGALMTLAPRAWYGAYGARGSPFGLSLLEDQQVAGAIMWMPAGLVYAVIAALLAVRWLHEAPVSRG